MIFTVLLNPSIDHVLKLESFKPGDTVMACYTDQFPLGKGLSVAYAVSALKEKVKVIGLMNRYDEPFYNRFADSRGIEYEWVYVDGRVRHNITLISLSKGVVTHVREPGFRVTRDSLEQINRKLAGLVSENDWVAFCGSLPKGAAVRTYRDLITTCRRKGSRVLLDTSGRPLKEGIRGKPTAVKPNLEEFEGIFSEKVNGIQHIALKAKSLLDRGLQHVFVSLGEDGLLAANSMFALRARVKVARPLNTVGCGDAMVAGFLVALQRKEGFEKVCSLGVACGAANAVGLGPGLVRLSDVRRFLGRIEKLSI